MCVTQVGSPVSGDRVNPHYFCQGETECEGEDENRQSGLLPLAMSFTSGSLLMTS